jgi:hypothetical protein
VVKGSACDLCDLISGSRRRLFACHRLHWLHKDTRPEDRQELFSVASVFSLIHTPRAFYPTEFVCPRNFSGRPSLHPTPRPPLRRN